MIFITGDIHGDDIKRLTSRCFPINKELTKEDFVICCGDFGVFNLAWSRYLIKWMNKKNFTTIFVDGNHENHTFLHSMPVREFRGARVHQLANSVYHVMRGEIINLSGYNFFCFGGARSHDISDGILYMSKGWHRQYTQALRLNKMVRVRDFDWWEAELPNSSEIANAWDNLLRFNNTVDFIVTHDCSFSSLSAFTDMPEHDTCVDFLEDVKNNVQFSHWYFGHHHEDLDISDRESCLYREVRRIV